MQRKNPIITGNVYHVMNKSIAGYQIFSSDVEYQRMMQIIRFFSYKGNLPKFSQFTNLSIVQEEGFEKCLKELVNEETKLIQAIAYCCMPTHVHLVLRQLRDNGIAIAMGNILNAYARYFNTKHKRKGPLWESRFKNVPVDSDEQLLHLSRYVHLNPVSAGLVENAHQWQYSSYGEYTAPEGISHPLCDFRDFINEQPSAYQAFVDDRAGYQRELAKIKKIALE
ncbi:MAG: transposase [Candidatus Yanofskybacteria bacterium]|nr:transposase [Candidatus Yanofskybacteria bacterium]